jgi:hypothetical protein
VRRGVRPCALAALPLVLAAAAALPARAEGAAIVVTPNSERFVPGDSSLPVPSLVLPQGGDLTYLNVHQFTAHSVTSDRCTDGQAHVGTGCPTGKRRIFDSGVRVFGEPVTVPNVANLAPNTYPFHCILHPAMRGTLVIV